MAALVARAEAVLFFHKFAGRTTQVCWPCCGREHVMPTNQRFANILTGREWPMDVVDATIRIAHQREFRPRDVEAVEALFKYAEELLPAGTVAPPWGWRRLLELAGAPEDDPGWKDGFDEWGRDVKKEDLARSASFSNRSWSDEGEGMCHELDLRRRLRRWGNPAEPMHYGSDEEVYECHHLTRTERYVKAGKPGSHKIRDWRRHVGWSGRYDGAPSVLYADSVTPNALRVVPSRDSYYDWYESTIWEWGAGFALRADGTLPADSWRGLGGGLGGALHRLEAVVAADGEALADESSAACERLIEQLGRARRPRSREHVLEEARARHAALRARAVELRRLATAPVCFELARIRALVLRGRATVSGTALERACRLPESLFRRVATLVGPLGERASGHVRLAEFQMDEGYLPLDRKYPSWRFGRGAPDWVDEDSQYKRAPSPKTPSWSDPVLMVPWVTLKFRVGHVEGDARYDKPELVISGWLSGFETFHDHGDYEFQEGASQYQLAAEKLLKEPTFRKLRLAATPRQWPDEDLEASTWQPPNAPSRPPQTALIR